LYAMARRHGIQVPLFFSGMHHGFDPAGHNPWNDASRTSPWYTTEFWSSRTWYHGYGAMSKPEQRQLNRGIWKIIAFGGSGYNFYMLVGSTNFWLWNDNELAACYDYSSAIGQAGDLRPIYYNMKRADYFARSFADILENSTNADDQYRNFATGVRVLARSGPAGSIVFLDNAKASPVVATLSSGLHLNIKAGAIRPVVLNTPLSATWTLVSGYSRIFGVQRQGHVTTVVIYGNPKRHADVTFAGSSMPKLSGPMQQLPRSKGNVFATHARFPTGDKPRVAMAQIGRRVLRVLIENRAQEMHTWFIRGTAGPMVVVGPAYAGALTEVGGKITLDTSTPLGQSPANALVYSAAAASQELLAPNVAGGGSIAAAAPALSAWQYKTLDAPASPAFGAGHWLHSQSPKPMGADGILSPWCWYRASISASKAEQATVHFGHVSNLASVFINGQWVATLTAAGNVNVHLQAGRNLLAVFTAEHGRSKLYAYHGALMPILAKGIWGHVTMFHGPVQKIALQHWQVKSMPNSYAADVSAIQHGYQAGDGWSSITSGTDYFHGRSGYAWYHRELPNIKMPGTVIVAFSHVDDEGTIFLNGHKLMTHRGWDQPFTVNLTRYLNAGGKNQLDVLVHNDSGAGGITGDVSLKLLQAGHITPIQDWQMHDGAAEQAVKTWRPLVPEPALALGIPRLYKAHFNYQPEPGIHLVLRASYKGLSSGHICINGHDLGLYPDNTMPMGLYIPSVWLKTGRNTIEILDERGQSPQQAGLVIETAASRRQTVLVQK
ncbi:MAG: sugar-binding domain-containing protein, partial [Phycisphaerae bacterium]